MSAAIVVVVVNTIVIVPWVIVPLKVGAAWRVGVGVIVGGSIGARVA